MSINEGSRLFSDGKIHAAINCFKAVVEKAKVENDLTLEGRALGNLATCYAKIDQHKQAIPLYEQAIDILHDDDKRKGSLLGYLRDSYKELKQHDKVAQVQAVIEKYKNVVLQSPNGATSMETVNDVSNNESKSKLENSKTKIKTNKNINKNKNMFSSFMSLFNPKEGPENIEEYMKMMKNLAGEQDDNEEYFLQHLMQTHLKDLPFNVVEKRMKSVETSLNGLEGLIECFASIHYQNAIVCERANAGKAAKLEGSGTFSHAVKQCEEYVQQMSLSNKNACKHISKEVLEKYSSLKIAHTAIVKDLLSRQHALASRIKYCEEAEFKAISSLATKQEAWVECLRTKDASSNGNSATKSTTRLPTVSATPSLDDFDLIMYEEYEADLDKRREEELEKSVEVAKTYVQESTALLSRARKDLVNGHQKICIQLELVESQRIDAVKSLLLNLIHAEICQLNEMKCSLSNLLEHVSVIDRSSDLRTFCNNEYVKSYLNGDIPREKFIDAKSNTDNSLVDVDENMIEQSVDDLFANPDDSSNGNNEGSQSNQLDMCSLCGLFEKAEYRYTLLRCLNKYRGKRTNVGNAFEKLVIILIAMLDASYIQGDVKSAKMILILAETFYHKTNEEKGEHTDGADSSEASNGVIAPGKEYVQNRIKGHAMWRSVAFWEEVFHQSVREEVERNFEVEKSGNGGLLLSTFQNIAYGQIYSCAFNMISCGVGQSTVELFIDRMCIANDLSCIQRQEILNGISKQ